MARLRANFVVVRIDDCSEYAAAPDDMLTGTRFNFENQETPLISNELGPSAHRGAWGDGLQVVYLNARAHGDDARRQFRQNGQHGGVLHQANHRRSGKDRRQSRIDMLDGPLWRDHSFDGGF